MPIGVHVKPDGVLIRNFLSTRRLAWGEIDRLAIGRWLGWGDFPCGVARLTEGGDVVIGALTPSLYGNHLEIVPLADVRNERLATATGGATR